VCVVGVGFWVGCGLCGLLWGGGLVFWLGFFFFFGGGGVSRAAKSFFFFFLGGGAGGGGGRKVPNLAKATSLLKFPNHTQLYPTGSNSLDE